jgi:hypothetical protein
VSKRSETSRRPVLDEGKKREICAILAMGCNRASAARYVGCHPDTIRRTAARDAEFAELLQQAESKHELRHLTFINKAAEEGRYWRAAAWALERCFPSRYGRRRPDMFTVEQVSHVLAQFADVILDEVPDHEQRERILARLSDLTAGLQSAAHGGEDE